MDDAPSRGGITGEILPPKATRVIADKTAEKVAESGAKWEAQLTQANLNNPKFQFLQPDNIFHRYYKLKVEEFRRLAEQKQTAAMPAPTPTPTTCPEATTSLPTVLNTYGMPTIPTVCPRENPIFPWFSLSAEDSPTGNRIGAFELEMIQQTAQFAVTYKGDFLQQLSSRERNNPQFNFLNPQHPRFTLFKRLITSYNEVLNMPKERNEQLRGDVQSAEAVLDRCARAAAWAKAEGEKKRLLAERAQEDQRKSFETVDWQDFVIVASIDLE